jgi:predicted DNA-binding transcriptional regulator AlpA
MGRSWTCVPPCQPLPTPSTTSAMSFNPLLKSQDVAEFFNVSSRTVLDWYYRGLIPARIHVGKVIRFDFDDVLEALERATRGSMRAGR